MKEDTRQKRRPYQKPQVERVELVVEEQVLGGCKTEATGGGPDAPPTGNCVTQLPACEFLIGT